MQPHILSSQAQALESLRAPGQDGNAGNEILAHVALRAFMPLQH